jgi:hypothetical protein
VISLLEKKVEKLKNELKELEQRKGEPASGSQFACGSKKYIC